MTDPELTAAVALGCQRAYQEIGIAHLQEPGTESDRRHTMTTEHFVPLTKWPQASIDRLLADVMAAPDEPLAYSPAATRRAEVLEAHDEANTPYQRMRRRAVVAEARCVDLEAEVERLRGVATRARLQIEAMEREGNRAA